MVVIVTGYTLFVTSCSHLETNVLAKFVDTACTLFYTHSSSSLLHNVSL